MIWSASDGIFGIKGGPDNRRVVSFRPCLMVYYLTLNPPHWVLCWTATVNSFPVLELGSIPLIPQETRDGFWFKYKSLVSVFYWKNPGLSSLKLVQREGFRELVIRQWENIQCMLEEIHSQMWHPGTAEKVQASASASPWVTEAIIPICPQ